MPRFYTTAKAMQELRVMTYGRMKINDWVDNFLDVCVAEGKAVSILTQWCISKELEVRYQQQKGFKPTKAELRLFERELPDIAALLQREGFGVEWWMTFNPSCLDSGRIAPELELEYKAMIKDIASPVTDDGWLLLMDWEQDILGGRSKPHDEVFSCIEQTIPAAALEMELKRHTLWTREEAGLSQSEEKIKQDVFFQIACEAEEGRLLGEEDSPFGEFILIPLETPERYDFFEYGCPGFKKRIATVLSFYPWRLAA
ncbi:hypothetical protein IID24_04650 [Patescibacteria group bacterium]|nr:hypothetical protein [Patescibacteria group bacterium]